MLCKDNELSVQTGPTRHRQKGAGSCCRSFFADAGWEVTQIGEDYGRDFEIEVFRDKKTDRRPVQCWTLKSTEGPSYSAKNEFMSVDLEVPNARYLAIELETPSILIQADVFQKKLFWSAPQVDAVLLNALALKRDDQSCTVRVPTKNELPATRDKLLDTVTSLLTVLTRGSWSRPAPGSLLRRPHRWPSTRLKQELRTTDALEMMEAQAVTESGDFDAARSSIQAVLASPLSSVESKFFALLVEEKNERLHAPWGRTIWLRTS